METRATSLHLRLALTHYERAQGELPENLSKLVDDGWYEEIPRDPFDGEPFRFSKDERSIWSIGPDGGNEPARYDPAEVARPHDEWERLCWKVPLPTSP
jgi:hypothetical protein